MITHILVALNLTEASKPALQAALDLARPVGALVTALHVTRPPQEHERWFMPFSSGEDTAFLSRCDHREHEAAREELEAEVAELSRPGDPRIETRVASGVPSHEIVAAARALHVDLIVTGTHGWHGLRHALRGSVAEHVIRDAPCSVLTVHAPA